MTVPQTLRPLMLGGTGSGSTDGCHLSERCYGTYLHGLFENKPIVDTLMRSISTSAADDFDYKAFKESQYDRLADEMRKHLDIDLIYKILSER